MNIIYEYECNPFYLKWKKHYCPKCGEKLEVTYQCEFLESKLWRKDKHKFKLGRCTYPIGKVEVRKPYFKCYKCDFQINVREMKLIEKNISGI